MDILDDDSFVRIFNELELAQKLPLERVCRKWHRILRSPSAYAKMQGVNIVDYVKETKAAQGEYQEGISGIVERAGPHIRQLDFNHRWPLIPQRIIDQIAQKCAQLTKLDMGWVRLDADISPLLEKIAGQLQEFSLEETSWTDEENAERITQFLPKMKQMRRLNLRKFDAPLDELAKLDSGTMEFLDVSETGQLSADSLVHFLDANPQLLVLHLCPMPPSCLPLIAMSTTSSINLPGPFLGFVRPPKVARRRFFSKEGELQRRPKPKKGGADLQVLINKLGSLKQLRTLWLGHIPYAAHFLSLKALAEMESLRHLHIKEVNAMDGNALSLILKELSGTLRQLSLLNCRQIDDFGGLSECQILSQLDVEKGSLLKNVDLEALGEHGKLRILRINECSAIKNRAILNILQKCHSLKELELIKCAGIGADLFANVEAFANVHKLERLSLQGCTEINCQSILKAVEVLPWDTLAQLDLSRNMAIDQSILAPIWDKLEKEKHQRKGKPLTLHVAGTGISRETDSAKFEPLIELMF